LAHHDGYDVAEAEVETATIMAIYCTKIILVMLVDIAAVKILSLKNLKYLFINADRVSRLITDGTASSPLSPKKLSLTI